MKKADNFDSSKWLVENKITFQSRLNENEIPGVNVEVDDDMITLSGDSGDYDGFIEDNGTVSFTVTNDEEEFNDQNWKDILGDDHAFVKIANSINTDVEALGDYVMITVKADDLTNMNESRLNEEESNDVLTQEDFDILGNKGFEINFSQPRHQLFWLERKYSSPRADFRYLENLLNKKNIPFRIEKRGYDGRGAAAKEIWIDTKYTDVPNPKVDPNE
jgi:hypothetical protein